MSAKHTQMTNPEPEKRLSGCAVARARFLPAGSIPAQSVAPSVRKRRTQFLAKLRVFIVTSGWEGPGLFGQALAFYYLFQRLSAADDAPLVSIHQHLGCQRAGVVGR